MMWLFGGKDEEPSKSNRQCSLEWKLSKEEMTKLMQGNPLGCKVNDLLIPFTIIFVPSSDKEWNMTTIMIHLDETHAKHINNITIRGSMKTKTDPFYHKNIYIRHWDHILFEEFNYSHKIGFIPTSDFKHIFHKFVVFFIDLEILQIDSKAITFVETEKLNESVEYELVMDSTEYWGSSLNMWANNSEKNQMTIRQYSLDIPGGEWTVDYYPIEHKFSLKILSMPKDITTIRAEHTFTLKINDRMKSITKQSTFSHAACNINDIRICFKDFVGNKLEGGEWMRLKVKIKIIDIAVNTQIIPYSKWAKYGIICLEKENDEKEEKHQQIYQNEIDALTKAVADISKQFVVFNNEVRNKMNAMQRKIDQQSQPQNTGNIGNKGKKRKKNRK
eukprot:308595_1